MFLVHVRNIAIAVAIAILLPIAVNVGNKLFIGYPTYPDSINTEQKDSPKWEAKNKEIQEALKDYKVESNRLNIYWGNVNFAIGLLLIFAALFIIPIDFLSTGFVIAGTICLISGSILNWNNLNIWIKFIALIFALVLLIFGSFKIAGSKEN